MMLRIVKTWLWVVGASVSLVAIVLLSTAVGVWVGGPFGVLVGFLTFTLLLVAEMELAMRRMGV